MSMTDGLSDYRPEEDLSFEDSRESELARRQAVNDLIPFLPPPPHQLSPEESKLEFERLKAEAYAELELEEMDEEHLFMHKAATMLSQLSKSAGFDTMLSKLSESPGFDVDYEKFHVWEYDAQYPWVEESEYERAIIGLAIGYARIGDIAKTNQIITDIVEYWAKIEINESLTRETKFRYVVEVGLEVIQARNEFFKLELRSELAAKVAYYSGWIGGLSSKEDVAEFAKTVSDPTQDFSSSFIPESASDYNQHLRGEITQQGEEAVFIALKQHDQEKIEVRNLQIELSKPGTAEEYYEEVHYGRSKKKSKLRKEYIKRKSILDGQRIVLSVVLMELAARKHKERLEAINSGKQAGVLKPHLELN
jgi:hypothetical protein